MMRSRALRVAGAALLCGIGFTMSLFIGLLAFNGPAVQDHVKIGILKGSLVSGVAGSIILAVSSRRKSDRTQHDQVTA